MVKMNSCNNNCSPFKLLLTATLLMLIATPLLYIQPTLAQTSQTQYIEKSFAWDYNGKHWTWNLSIPQALYDAYKSVPVSTRTRNGPGGYGFLTTTQDYYIQSLALKLNDTANSMHYGSYDKVSFALAFVQSLQYASDNVTEGFNEYPRFPIETLVDDGGDCEDTSILFASITLIMGYGTVYISPPNHYAVGILGNGLRGTSWTYPKDSNNTYYYCETTGNGFKIGQLPDEFASENAYIYPIDESRQYKPAISIAPTPRTTGAPVTTTIGTPPPTVNNPNIQQAKPMSFNLFVENPLFTAGIVLLILLAVFATIWSVRKTKNHIIPETAPSVEPAPPSIAEDSAGKFCIFCGEKNKGYAAFCEKCGKQIG
jgi:heme/copper-type cytochrome/quinol oxidase subunit 2